MMLETRYAEFIIRLVENARYLGRSQLAVELLPTEMCLQPDLVDSVTTIDDALDYLEVKMRYRDLSAGGPDHPVYDQHADEFLKALNKLIH